MMKQRRTTPRLRKTILAGLIAPVAAWAGTQEAIPAPSASNTTDSGTSHCDCVYSVINLGPEAGGAALLNENGQAAFGSINYYGVVNGFFDGDKIVAIGSLGGSYTWVNALNKSGVVTGQSEDAGSPYSNILAFYWSAGGGIHALGGGALAEGKAINDHGRIVGLASAPGISGRAVRWNPDGSVTALGPLPLSLSEAEAINNRGMSAGFGEVASGDIHAMLWDRAGNQTDLGTPGGHSSFGMHINEHEAVAGDGATAAGDAIGFFWSRNSGMVPINASGGGARTVSDLNDHGVVVGDTEIAGQSLAYQWTLTRGLVSLPSGSAVRSDVFDINNHGDMVGALERPAAEGGDLRAVRWPGMNTPIDLNTRLHRPPAGLVVYAAAAINENGVILAHSNAGLVMLRPGKQGSDAPVLGPIADLPRFVGLNQDFTLTVGLVDNSPTQTHKASVEWSDGCPSPAPTLSEAHGVGQVGLQHRFCAAGFQSVKVKVTDSGGRSTEIQQDIVVEDPSTTSLSGKGTLAAAPVPSGPDFRQQPLQFSLWTPLAKASGTARPVVTLCGPFLFRADQVSKASASAEQIRVEGSGSFNGRPGYRFQLDARPAASGQAGSKGQLRVRLSHQDGRTGAEVLDYDNGAPPGSTGPSTAMSTATSTATSTTMSQTMSTASSARTTTARDGTALSEGSLRLRN